jgi:hypothetical protein
MQHYWGSRAIMARLGFGSENTLYRYIRKLGLPVYKRVHPKSPIRTLLYTNETLLLQWELTMCKSYRERLIGGKTVADPVRILRMPSGRIQRDVSELTSERHDSPAVEQGEPSPGGLRA